MGLFSNSNFVYLFVLCSGCWNRAREKLHLGIKMCATPLPSLHSATDELEARVLRASVKASENADSDDDNEMDISDVGSHRKMLGKLRGLGRKHNAPIFRLAQGGPGKISKVQTPAVQKSFDVFVDQCPSAKALFGFFDDREKVTLHLTNDENLSKSSSKMVASKASIVSQVPVPDFEVYTDVVEEQKPKVAPKGAPQKAKLRIRKCLAQVSVEEMYALRLYPNSVN
uniref:Uncharacterized protein n=1 Tax=Ditylenchus dipsaci TaxID=166011 RepID=A0A915E207_9BILA